MDVGNAPFHARPQYRPGFLSGVQTRNYYQEGDKWRQQQFQDHEVGFTVISFTNLSPEVIIAARRAKAKHHF